MPPLIVSLQSGSKASNASTVAQISSAISIVGTRISNSISQWAGTTLLPVPLDEANVERQLSVVVC